MIPLAYVVVAGLGFAGTPATEERARPGDRLADLVISSVARPAAAPAGPAGWP
jgi:hypothetical protein